jgi:hypothetical protein
MNNEQLTELMTFCKSNKRVCPKPDKWNKFWEMLPNKTRVGNEWNPSLPLILSAWSFTSNLEKEIRFNEHLKYSLESDYLDQSCKFLYALSEEDWHHLND